MTTAAPVRAIRTLLIANRNEIARRIIRAARALGIRTVAVYSEADAQALHVHEADEAYCIGPAPSLDSYLRIDTLIATAQRAGADAIHPGYGFVSENPAFAQACLDAGITLVGPTPQAIADMADKAQAKRIAEQAGLPCIPGFSKADATVSELMEAAQRIGYPVMIKALAGGGGRGMRLVMNPEEFASQLNSAQIEARNAFNDERVMLEKAIINPRHIEVQVLADQHGHAIHLGERDCSVQRRHQKIVEEAPSPAVDAALRERLGASALKLVQATGYVGAGTVEYLLDTQGQFYFIEMNTRLQVEHGVTEAITGLDIVQWQLRIAGGEPLTVQQSDVRFDGHSIQARLCAEDPARDFMPQTGPVLAWSEDPQARTDHAVAVGGEVSPWYDSLLAKVIVHAPTRQAACQRLADALGRTVLVGFEHNGLYLQRICQHPDFQAGSATTAFLGDHATELLSPRDTQAATALAAVCLAHLPHGGQTTWPTGLNGYSSTRALSRPLRLVVAGQRVDAVVGAWTDDGRCDVSVAGADVLAVSQLHARETGGGWQVQALVNARPVKARVCHTADGVWIHESGCPQATWVANNSLLLSPPPAEGVFQALVKSPMNGKVTQILAAPGDHVEAGQVLLCMEAMKMEHRISAKSAALVEQIHVSVGEQLGMGQPLVRLSPV